MFIEKRSAAILSIAALFAAIAGNAVAQQRTVLQTIDYARLCMNMSLAACWAIYSRPNTPVR